MHHARIPLALVLLSSFSAPAAAAPPPAQTDVMRLARCARAQATEYEVRLDGDLRLVRAFLDPALSEDDNLRLAARHQIKYLWGYLRTEPTWNARLQFVLAAPPPEVDIVSKREAPYDRALSLDWKDTELVKIDDVYTARAVRRGRTEKNDPAIFARYSARFRAVMCSDAELPGGRLEAPLPDDPWLLYWHVPAKEHRLMRYYDEHAVVNPCNHDDFVTFPAPIYYWYDWYPARNGADGEGKPFDCSAWLRPGVDYFPHTAALLRAQSAGPDFSTMRRELSADTKSPLGATVIIGVLDHLWPSLAMPELLREIGASGRDPSVRAAAALRAGTSRERGAHKLLQMLADINDVLRPTSYRANVDKGYLGVEIEGRLRRSGRAVRLRAHYGITDALGPKPPAHWEIARRALARDHIVVYAGHSGVGENMSIPRIAKELRLDPAKLLAEAARAPFQLVAYLSCYSYMYFGADLIPAEAARAEPRREFVLTGTEFTQGDRGGLAMIDFVDQVLAEPDATARPPALRFVDPNEFFIFKGFNGARKKPSP